MRNATEGLPLVVPSFSSATSLMSAAIKLPGSRSGQQPSPSKITPMGIIGLTFQCFQRSLELLERERALDHGRGIVDRRDRGLTGRRRHAQVFRDLNAAALRGRVRSLEGLQLPLPDFALIEAKLL